MYDVVLINAQCDFCAAHDERVNGIVQLCTDLHAKQQLGMIYVVIEEHPPHHISFADSWMILTSNTPCRAGDVVHLDKDNSFYVGKQKVVRVGYREHPDHPREKTFTAVPSTERHPRDEEGVYFPKAGIRLHEPHCIKGDPGHAHPQSISYMLSEIKPVYSVDMHDNHITMVRTGRAPDIQEDSPMAGALKKFILNRLDACDHTMLLVGFDGCISFQAVVDDLVHMGVSQRVQPVQGLCPVIHSSTINFYTRS